MISLVCVYERVKNGMGQQLVTACVVLVLFV